MAQFTMPAPAKITLTATMLTRLLYLKAGASLGLKISEWWLEGAGISGSAVPILVSLRKVTTDVTGHTSVTPISTGSTLEADVSAAMGGYSGTGGGTAGDAPYNHLIPPSSGKHVMFALGDEIVLGKGERYVLEATAPAIVDVICGWKWRE